MCQKCIVTNTYDRKQHHFLPRVQCISIPIAKIKFFKEFNGGKINFFGGFVHTSRTYIGYIV